MVQTNINSPSKMKNDATRKTPLFSAFFSSAYTHTHTHTNILSFPFLVERKQAFICVLFWVCVLATVRLCVRQICVPDIKCEVTRKRACAVADLSICRWLIDSDSKPLMKNYDFKNISDNTKHLSEMHDIFSQLSFAQNWIKSNLLQQCLFFIQNRAFCGKPQTE